MVESSAALAGAPVMLLVIVTVQVRVLAPPPADWLHWSTPVMGDVEVVSLATPLTLVTIVDAVVDVPSALYVMLLVMVTTHVVVVAPSFATSLHWTMGGPRSRAEAAGTPNAGSHRAARKATGTMARAFFVVLLPLQRRPQQVRMVCHFGRRRAHL